jgi:hypothetical protein
MAIDLTNAGEENIRGEVKIQIRGTIRPSPPNTGEDFRIWIPENGVQAFKVPRGNELQSMPPKNIEDTVLFFTER